MILKGSQRSGSGQLSKHLLNGEENEHVEVHEVRGFIGGSVQGALKEADAISQGTRCKQFLFSLSLSPPPNENVPIKAFEHALEAVEKKLGLKGQPRVVVFHEKEGRRHAHCVWSRIDSREMKAINLPYYKLKLRDISKQLYLKHGWKLPPGFINKKNKNPLNFTRAEWQQAKRTKQDPKAIKADLRECWATSDSKKAFVQALQERGYYLARGDRRGYVALDIHGEVYSLSRWTGVNTKALAERLGDPKKFPSVEDTREHINSQLGDLLRAYLDELRKEHKQAFRPMLQKKRSIIARQRTERIKQKKRHQQRRERETNVRAARLRKGLKGLWDRLTGTYRRLRQQNEKETYQSFGRDRTEREALIVRQLQERQILQRKLATARKTFREERTQLKRNFTLHFGSMQHDKGQNDIEFGHPRGQSKPRSNDGDGPEPEL